jgi:hypothetical protein
MTLQAAGFVVTTEKTALGVARVFIRGIAAGSLPECRKKLESLGFSTYLVKKEKTESAELARRTDVVLPAAVTAP